MNCWQDDTRPPGRGSREVRPTEPAPQIAGAPRSPGASTCAPRFFPGEEVLVVRRRRTVLRAVVVHLAERWGRDGGRLVPLPHHAPKHQRQVGLAVRADDGTWRPVALHRTQLRSGVWRPPPRGLAWSRAEIDGRAEADVYAWRALEERTPWLVGELPVMEQLRLEARRLGAVYGYAHCCAADYAARIPEIEPTPEQRAASLGGGFVPCPRCARRPAGYHARGRPDLAACALLALVGDRLYPGPLWLPGRGPIAVPEPSPLDVDTRTFEAQPAAWRALVDARARRVEAAATAMRLRSGGRRGQPRTPLPRAAEAQAILQHWIDRETRLIDSLRWLLTERRPPLAKKPPTPRGGRRPW